MKRFLVVGGLSAAFLAALAGSAGEPAPGGRPLADVVAAARASGKGGAELVEHARRLVRDQFVEYSTLTPWLSATDAFERRRGYSAQYNGALAVVLRELGFADAQTVFAARVLDATDRPWWRNAHVWVQLRLDGRLRDVCVALADEDGRLLFSPVTSVQPFGPRTRVNTTVVLMLVAAWFRWRQLAGHPMPRFLRRPFDERPRRGDRQPPGT